MSAVRVANAPLSYGAFEMTVGTDFAVPDPVDVLTAIREAGFEGTDLGPPGYLGEGDELRRRLDAEQLGIAGGFVADRLQRSRALGGGPRRPAPHARPVRRRRRDGAHPPRPVLCDAGGPDRVANPGRGGEDASLRAGRPPLGHARRRRRPRGRRRPRARLRAGLPPPHVDLRRGPAGDRAFPRGHGRGAAARQRASRGRGRRPDRRPARLGRSDRGGPPQGRAARRARAT